MDVIKRLEQMQVDAKSAETKIVQGNLDKVTKDKDVLQLAAERDNSKALSNDLVAE